MIWAGLGVTWALWIVLMVGMVLSARRRGRNVSVCDAVALLIGVSLLALAVGHWSARVALGICGLASALAVVSVIMGVISDLAEKRR